MDEDNTYTVADSENGWIMWQGKALSARHAFEACLVNLGYGSTNEASVSRPELLTRLSVFKGRCGYCKHDAMDPNCGHRKSK